MSNATEETTTTGQSTAPSAGHKGLDLGTSRIVLASERGGKMQFEEQLNAFLALPYTKMTDGMLEREGILHRSRDSEILAYGNRIDEFANIFGGDTRRPMQRGMLNPGEPEGLEMLEMALEEICGKGKRGEKICFSVPSAPRNEDHDLLFHERTITQFLESLNYEVSSVNEGLAVVYSELESNGFTGIGISFGGGMCNVCVAYKGLPALAFCTTRAGDYIDHSTAHVSGETPTTVRLRKENEFHLGKPSSNTIDQALGVYYGDVIHEVVQALKRELSETKRLPRLTEDIPIVCAGGTAVVSGFIGEFRKAVERAKLPIGISGVTLAKEPLNTSARGTLIAAMMNM